MWRTPPVPVRVCTRPEQARGATHVTRLGARRGLDAKCAGRRGESAESKYLVGWVETVSQRLVSGQGKSRFPQRWNAAHDARVFPALALPRSGSTGRRTRITPPSQPGLPSSPRYAVWTCLRPHLMPESRPCQAASTYLTILTIQIFGLEGRVISGDNPPAPTKSVWSPGHRRRCNRGGCRRKRPHGGTG